MRRFTSTEDATLRKLWRDHALLADIAKQLKRDTGVVRRRVYHLGLRRNKTVTRVSRWAPKHLLEGRDRMTPRAFLDACYAWREEERRRPNEAKRQAIEAAAKKIDADEDMGRDEKICAKAQAGMSYASIARDYGLTRQRVMQIVHEVDLERRAAERVKRIYGMWLKMPRTDKEAFLKKVGVHAA